MHLKVAVLESHSTQVPNSICSTKISCNGRKSGGDWRALPNFGEKICHAELSTNVGRDFEITMGTKALGVDLALGLREVVS